MNVLRKISSVLSAGSNIIAKILKVVLAILVFACFAVLVLQVINRYILVKQTLFEWRSLQWTEELSRMLLIYISYLSIGIVFKYGKMARVDILYNRLNDSARMALYCLVTALNLFFLYFLVRYSVTFSVVNSMQKSDVLRVPIYYVSCLPAAGGVLLAYEVVTEFLEVICGVRKPFEVVAPDDDDEEEESAHGSI